MNAEIRELQVPCEDFISSPFGADRVRARAVFDVELARLDVLMQREMIRLKARYELSQEEYRGLYVSDRQIEALLKGASRPGITSVVDALNARSDELNSELARRPEFAATPWEGLARRLQLSRLERDLLLLAIAPELDPKYENIIAYLNNDVARKLPTGDLATRLFASDTASRASIRESIAPASRVAGIGLIECVAAAREMPRMQRGIRMAAPVVDWLCGLPYVDERCAHAIEWLESDRSVAMPREVESRCAATGLDRFRAHILVASSEEESAESARRILSIDRRRGIALDLAMVRADAAPADMVSAVALMARVFDAAIVASPLQALTEADGRIHEAGAAAARRLLCNAALSMWCSDTRTRFHDVLRTADDATAQVVDLPELSVSERVSAWRSALGHESTSVDVERLADRYAFGPARIARVVDRANRRPAEQGAPFREDRLAKIAREVSVERCTGVSSIVVTPLDWEDLVLPATVDRQIRDFVHSIELRARVLDDWGFGPRLGNPRSSTLLLKGVSGGGKTLTAKLIAKTLAVDLHRVDLSCVVSKYIGETEKNLDRAFDAARRASAVLFIDEADALFGKRSEVKDAHDRYANVETAYLLQKMEDHEGVVILATNLANNIDEAFLRRLQHVIEIPMPDAVGRERIWRRMLGGRAPIAADVNIPFLARQFAFAGGDIRNMVLEAAYLAAQERTELTMRHFVRAVSRQYAKRGKVATIADFREYGGLLKEGHV